MNKPALAMIELKSVAKGIVATDAIAKKAVVDILSTNPVCPGKYAIIFAGEVGDVEEGIKAGIEASGDMIINQLFLPNIHPDIIPAITATTNIKEFKSIGIIESFSIASCVMGADRAAKAAPVELVEMRLANGLGGKGYFVFTGELPDVEAAIDAAEDYIKKEGLLAGSEIIANPHPDLIAKGVYWGGF
ncbi:MAG: BMC domain-containing protein [Gammaproteobacteria bacterium]|nr:BMC domain-containing protein [Gammaproteobacteria bacterium]